MVAAPGGEFAAASIAWIDEENRVGQFEPVGTHPDHRRKGLGRAMLTAGLRAMRSRGCRTALVGHDEDDERSGAFYRSVGFREVARRRVHEARFPA